MTRKRREVTLIEALLPIVFLISFLGINVYIFGDSSLDGANQMALLFSAAFAALMAWGRGFRWNEVQEKIVSSIHSAIPSILILLMIGAVSGSWLVSGIVPVMIYYGLLILHPEYFLVAACIVCAIVSLATGSSWTTAGTIGIALMGVGQAMEIHSGLVAGAVISGAYFGDKLSPLSDTTNLAPAVAGTDLFTHIRYMTWTTIPSMLITLVIFMTIGLTQNTPVNGYETSKLLETLTDSFNITPILLLVPAIVLTLIILKIQALPSLFAGVILALLFALIFQSDIIHEVSQVEIKNWKSLFVGSMKSMYGNIKISTNDEMMNELLASKGMYGMLNTVWLILCAMVFGGVMEGTGLLKKIVKLLTDRVERTGSLIASNAFTCVFFNATASDQYLAIVVPGRMFADAYKEKKLAPENLSRTLEDSGTVTSVLVPWNTCGAYHAGILGVSTITFAPFCFFNIISPLITIVFGYLKINIHRLSSKKEV